MSTRFCPGNEMKIAVLCKTLQKGGAEKQALILTKLLSDKGIDVSLINWFGNKIDHRYLRFITDNSFRYFPLSGNYLKKFRTFGKTIRRNDVSIIVSYLTLPNFVSGLTRLLNKEILSIGGIRNEKLPYHKFIFEKLIHNRLNDATVFNNFSAKKKFVKLGFKSEKIHVIHNALEVAQNQEKDEKPDGEIRIITVGRFVKQKDYGTALKAFNTLLEQNNRIKFAYYIVGYGPLENKIRNLAQKLEINDKVKIFVNPPDIHGVLNKCDIFLSTSLFEGVSNSIMEAMAAGLPVVATNVGDNNYLVKDGFNGYLVPCRDTTKIVEKLEILARSQTLRKDFGKNSLTLIKREFSNEKMLKNYLKLFSELTQNHRSL